jgi:hypothetical protein
VALGRHPRAQQGEELVAEQRIEGALLEAERLERFDRDLPKPCPPGALVQRELRERDRPAGGSGTPR